MSRTRNTEAFMSRDEGNSQIDSEVCVDNDQRITIAYIAGCPGSGKTTLASWLDQKLLDWDVLNKDHIKLKLLGECNFDRLSDQGEIDRTRNLVNLKAFDQLFQRIEEYVGEGHRSIIVDNWGYVNNHGSVETTLGHIHSIMRKYPGKARLKVILCQAPKEKRDQRIKQRGSQLWPYLDEWPETPDDEKAERMLAHLQEEDILKLDTSADREEVLASNGFEVLQHLDMRITALA